MDGTTIDQFAVFIAVVEERSFAAAGRRLDRSTAAITESIGRLERHSRISLFDRSTYRPSLTEAGRALLPRARQIVHDVEEYSLTARGIANGLEPQVSLMIDAIAPMPLIVDALRAFHEIFPAMPVRVSVESFEAVLQALSDSSADLGIVVFGYHQQNLEHRVCGEIDLVPVAAPHHPLARFSGAIPPELLSDHVQLVLSTRSPLRDPKAYGVLSVSRWHMTDLETKHALLLAGVGWGLMPHHRVAADLGAGRLVVIKPSRWDNVDRSPRFPFVVAHPRNKALGPATRWLVDRLAKSRERPLATVSLECGMSDPRPL